MGVEKVVEKVVHMVGGEGKHSYVVNSDVQKVAISQAKPILEATVTDLYRKTFPKCFTVADMGCSSGPNALLAISHIIDAIDDVRRSMGHASPEFQVHLNDLPGNDFNTIFKSIPYFVEKLGKDKGGDFGPCFIGGMPGSFFGRLFPAETLNFVHSSNSAHFLSQVPPGIESSNKGNIYIAKTSPPNVPKAYLTQYQKDFKLFLSSRSEELTPEGRMVIAIIGRRNQDPSTEGCTYAWELLGETLCNMASQGLVEEAKLQSFNIPCYFPNGDEVTAIIQEQGSFHLDLLETFDVNWNTIGALENKDLGEHISKSIRAVAESMLVTHFGEEIIDDLFQKYSNHVAEDLVLENCRNVLLVTCMTKKG